MASLSVPSLAEHTPSDEPDAARKDRLIFRSAIENLPDSSIREMSRTELLRVIHAANPSSIGRPELIVCLHALDDRLLLRLAFLARRWFRNIRRAENCLSVQPNLASVSNF